MATRFNEPTVQFLIEVTIPTCELIVDRFVIQQNGGTSRGPKRLFDLYNSVQSHLHGLHKKTGLNYRIVFWGQPADYSRWLEGEPLDF